MKPCLQAAVFALMSLAGAVQAQQASEQGAYTIHFSAMNTSQLTPEIARAYGIQRSSSLAMLNITVLKKGADGQQRAVTAVVKASGRNLTGQLREISMREIREGEAIYYIGVFRVNNMETFDFSVQVTPQGESRPLEVRFRQQFFTE